MALDSFPLLLLFQLHLCFTERAWKSGKFWDALPSPMLDSLSKGKALQGHHLASQSVGVCREPGFDAGCILPGIC